MKERLSHIAQAEHCQFTETQLDEILELADGDMRRAVTTLQSAHALAAGGTEPLDVSAMAEIAGLPPAHVVEALWASMSKQMAFDAMQRAVEEVCANGYSAQLLLSSLSQKVIVCPDLNEIGRADISIRIAEAEKNMIEGADEYLQLLTVCSLAQSCLTEFKSSQ
jgi:replication factor C subunit 2/4